MPPKEKENFSLGVTALLDDLLKDEGKVEPPKRDEDAMRKTFMKTRALCEEAAQYFKLIAAEEADAFREADEKREKAERRLGLNDTLDSLAAGPGLNLNATTDSLYEALEENEAMLGRLRQDIVDLMHRKGGGQIQVATDTPFARTVDFSSLGATMGGFDMPAVLDFERLLDECERMQAELEQWEGKQGGLKSTPQGWRRLDPQELNR
eukprot:gb/GFBE01081972.1/.p1 GENE.gb/GFBE01081972.1/~~gb/GFBE01081972.1/.p1  ORF type:complete len:208 (+),score=73.08 gb/GFBE01081972.1/:1-624(+)